MRQLGMEPKRGNNNLGMRPLFWECDPTNIKSLERVYTLSLQALY